MEAPTAAPTELGAPMEVGELKITRFDIECQGRNGVRAVVKPIQQIHVGTYMVPL